MKKLLPLLMLLLSLSAAAQKQKFDFMAVMDKDTVHVETVGGDLALEWNNGHVDLYPYSNGVYDVGTTTKIVCFDDYTLARYMIIYYKKDHQIDFAIVQYNNGEGFEMKPIPAKGGKGK